jgi:hypothetical protein
MQPEFWLQIVIAVCSAVSSALAVYVGIKVDLAVTREKAVNAFSAAEKAHRRIDEHIENHPR